jgi:predicted ferric reductase
MKYEHWKRVHSFMIVPYLVGLIHYYGSSTLGPWQWSGFSLWLNLVNLAGIASAIYSVFIYESVALRFRYRVAAVRPVAAGVVEITGRAVGRRLHFRAGQFTFLRFIKSRSSFPSHPFTISGAPAEGMIQFTIKDLGDHTSGLISAVARGDEFAVSRAHGAFDPASGLRRQVWIAGGIGVTPFRSLCQAGLPSDLSVDFFYAYQGADQAAYVEELSRSTPANVRFHPINRSRDGYLTSERISQLVEAHSPVDVYFCGPAAMRRTLRRGLRRGGFPLAGFHYEQFSFGR